MTIAIPLDFNVVLSNLVLKLMSIDRKCAHTMYFNNVEFKKKFKKTEM